MIYDLRSLAPTLSLAFARLLARSFARLLARLLVRQEVDDEKNAETYGAGVAARDILNTRDPPAEFQPIYGEMNRIVNRVERCSSVSRTSASLERFSTGRDPDQVMVQSDGSVQT